MAKKNTGQAPLTPAVLHILLALSAGERHGDGIMKQVEADSQGKVKMGPGTLYGSMGRMMEAGLIRESDKRGDPEMDDERRGYYQITGAGRGAVGGGVEAGLIRESDKRVDPEMDDERRIYYQITGAGRAALEAELKRYRDVVAVAKARLAKEKLAQRQQC